MRQRPRPFRACGSCNALYCQICLESKFTENLWTSSAHLPMEEWSCPRCLSQCVCKGCRNKSQSGGNGERSRSSKRRSARSGSSSGSGSAPGSTGSGGRIRRVRRSNKQARYTLVELIKAGHGDAMYDPLVDPCEALTRKRERCHEVLDAVEGLINLAQFHKDELDSEIQNYIAAASKAGVPLTTTTGSTTTTTGTTTTTTTGMRHRSPPKQRPAPPQMAVAVHQMYQSLPGAPLPPTLAPLTGIPQPMLTSATPEPTSFVQASWEQRPSCAVVPLVAVSGVANTSAGHILKPPAVSPTPSPTGSSTAVIMGAPARIGQQVSGQIVSPYATVARRVVGATGPADGQAMVC